MNRKTFALLLAAILLAAALAGCAKRAAPAPAAIPASDGEAGYGESIYDESVYGEGTYQAADADGDVFAPEPLDGVHKCDGYSYILYSDRTATVTGYYGQDDPEVPGWEIAIPETLDGYPVTAVEGFRESDAGYRITGIMLPDSVKTLRKSAFYDCDALEWIYLPEGLVSIEDYAFARCSSLRSINIPASVSNIGMNAFSGCEYPTLTVADGSAAFRAVDNVLFSKDMTRLVTYIGYPDSEAYAIPNGVVTIGAGAFYDCDTLHSITIPDGVVTIEANAFYGCKNLRSITVPEGVVHIGEDAFSGCRSLSEISLPGTATTIGDFDGCAFESFTVPPGVTELNASFMDCTSLRTFVIPEGVTSVRSQFEGCFSLRDIYLPNSATDIYGQIDITSRETTATIVCHSGSYAESLAMRAGMDYRIE